MLRPITLFVVLLAIAAGGWAQPTSTIEKVEISGISEERLSANLRDALHKLEGLTYDPQAADQLAQRIQSELPDYVATPTSVPGSQPSQVKLIFSVAHNINSKYVVEAVELKDVDRSKVSNDLWEQMQKMVGHPVDDTEADRLRERLVKECQKCDLHVTRTVIRGDQPLHVKIVYQGHSQHSINVGFGGGNSYHSQQKFSGKLNLAYTRYDVVGLKVELMNNSSDLMERYAGYRAGIWTEQKRFRFTVNYSSLRAQWSPETQQAAGNGLSSPLYRLRDTIEPTAKITFTPAIHLTLGVASTQLQMQNPAPHFIFSNRAFGNVDYSASGKSQKNIYSGNYEFHVSGHTLGGDTVYTRHQLNQSYTYTANPSAKGSPQAWLKLGRITGNAPMFERFSLGDANLLLGWNKYDISPLGGSRMIYGSIGYSTNYFSAYFETGSVWDPGSPRVLRKSVSLHAPLGTVFHLHGQARFIFNALSPSVGVPIRGSHATPMIAISSGEN